jgi:Tfp pilus assembly protein PilW
MKQSSRSNVRRGLSVAECLISLAITASLLTAVGAAYSASSDAVKANDEFFRASQAARVSVNQIVAEVRKCRSGVVDDTTLELTTANGDVKTYSLNADTRKMTMTIDGVTPITTNMASNIDDLEFTTDGQTISVTVTVKVGSNLVRLSGSAIPRRTLTYD